MFIPVGLAGVVTIVLLVGLGIFFYPWLLKQRGGLLVALVLTALLGLLFYRFDNPVGEATGTSALLAAIWAGLPLLIGLLLKVLTGKRAVRE